MSNNYGRRKRLFDLFSTNLELVMKQNGVDYDDKLSGGMLCPICVEPFFETNLKDNGQNFLTLEDVPPKAVGGSVLTLTCKRCNSKGGHEIDHHLSKKIDETDFSKFPKGSETKASFEVNGKKVRGKVSIDDSQTINFQLSHKNNNTSDLDKFTKDLNPLGTKMTINVPITSQERKANLALLRAGYLKAFGELGYGFLLNDNLGYIRYQLLHPEEEIIPEPFWLNMEYPDSCLGINMLTKPQSLQSYLVVFDILRNKIKRRVGIILPGPKNKDLAIYRQIQKIKEEKTEIEGFELQTISDPEINSLTDEDYVLSSTDVWNDYCTKTK